VGAGASLSVAELDGVLLAELLRQQLILIL
jgi:hypothetical protein